MERILTTHTGSLPRPHPMPDLLLKQQRGDLENEMELHQSVRDAVASLVEGACPASQELW